MLYNAKFHCTVHISIPCLVAAPGLIEIIPALGPAPLQGFSPLPPGLRHSLLPPSLCFTD